MEREDLPSEYTLHLNGWLPLFPLPDKNEVFGGTIATVGDLALIEQVRRKAFGADDPTVGTDVFILALGEPERRDVTKVGGLPYRSADMAWPTNPDGRPMTFLAQYRFAESRDLLPGLPGDVLLIFARDDDVANPLEFHFEWVSLGLGNLIAQEDAPDPAWQFVTCYGVRHRTVDYAFTDLEVPRQRLAPFIAKRAPFGDFGAVTGFCALSGIKIGGLPSWLYGNDPEIASFVGKRFLCSLTQILRSTDTPYPWLNQPEPLPMDILKVLNPEETLFFFDGFSIFLFLGPDGEVDAYMQVA